MLKHMCVGYLCVYMCCPAFCFCGVFLLGPEGFFLEVQTSLKESKIESWEREKRGERGTERGSERWTEIK